MLPLPSNTIKQARADPIVEKRWKEELKAASLAPVENVRLDRRR
jgi:hypothetical protein